MPKLYLALDHATLEENLAIAGETLPFVDGFKVGMRLFYRYGTLGYAAIAQLGLPIFLDLKLNDIPQTVSGALSALFSVLAPQPKLITVHAMGGVSMLSEAVEVCRNYNVGVLAVTVLTSLNAQDLQDIGFQNTDPNQVVLSLVGLAHRAHCLGVVCSPQELKVVKQNFTHLLCVTPGIRLESASGGGDDQKRTMTPLQAVQDGADILVVGRPILKAAHPVEVVQRIRKDL